MQLDRVTVAIRPRPVFEAVDLGFLLARTHAAPVWLASVPVVIGFTLIACLLFPDSPGLASLFVWWFKPLYDRLVLHVLSRAVFGTVPGPLATLRALPALLRRGALVSLSIMRFDAARSLNLAPFQLEGLPYLLWRKRVQLLEGPIRSDAGWLTAICILFEFTLAIGLLAMIALLVPAEMQERFLQWLASAAPGAWIAFAAWVVAVVIVEPFYVAGGFALYLNRRTQLEAWDLEIAFRALVRRHAEQPPEAAA